MKRPPALTEQGQRVDSSRGQSVTSTNRIGVFYCPGLRLLLHLRRERLPRLASEGETGTVRVLGVTDQDRARDGGDLDAVAARTARVGLTSASSDHYHISLLISHISSIDSAGDSAHDLIRLITVTRSPTS